MGNDGSFGEGDYILFYAEGPVTWDYDAEDDFYRQKAHGYSGDIFYFLSSSQGEATIIPEIDNRGLTPNRMVNEYDLYRAYEREWYNLIGSGRKWYSQRIDVDAYDTTFTIVGMQAGDPVKIEAIMAGRSKFSGRRGYLHVNDQQVESVSFPAMDFSRSYYSYAIDSVLEYTISATGSEINLSVSYDKYDQTDEAYLDYITINARCDLAHNGNNTWFRDAESVGEGNIAEFSISGAGSSSQVWDITDINNIFSLAGSLNGGTFSFTASADTLRQYVVLDLNGDFPKPVINSEESGVGEVQNQNLRSLPSVNYIIVAPNVFTDQAERLAEFHRHESGLTVEVVNPQHIYNEFSSGTPDVSAMRDFFRYQYHKGDTENSLGYVLLFGDGSFNNHISKEGNTNYILTYQSEESLYPASSYTSDDFFGLLDEGEGNIDRSLAGKLDIGIGRLPVKALDGSEFEAKGVVDKLLAYYSSEHSEWRRRLCFVGDDGYDPGGYNERYTHMSNADTIAKHADRLHPGFELKKVYLDAYPQVSSATGDAYPDVNDELQNLFSRGILTFCYSGHGSENQITGELILQKSDLQTMTNREVLPLFITATCSFSRYDHVDIEEDNNYAIEPLTSAGESGILNHDGGAIALLTTSRVVYSTSNTILAKNVFTNLFSKDENGNPLPLGEVIRLAKNMMGQELNKLNFTLLGDPAMVLNYPRY